jgi:hypothetical protein
VAIDGITIHHLVNEKIMDSYVSWDAWGLMQQLGLVASLGEPKAAAAH